MVFVGVSAFKGIYDTGAPPAHCGQDIKNCISPYVVVDKAPLTAAKPFISADSATGKFKLHIPTPRRNSSGADTDLTASTWKAVPSVDFSSVYVASAADTAKKINAKLRAGLHVVLAPGIYQLEESLQVTKSGTVLLGLGIATLIPTAGTPVVTVAASATGEPQRNAMVFFPSAQRACAVHAERGAQSVGAENRRPRGRAAATSRDHALAHAPAVGRQQHEARCVGR